MTCSPAQARERWENQLLGCSRTPAAACIPGRCRVMGQRCSEGRKTHEALIMWVMGQYVHYPQIEKPGSQNSPLYPHSRVCPSEKSSSSRAASVKPLSYTVAVRKKAECDAFYCAVTWAGSLEKWSASSAGCWKHDHILNSGPTVTSWLPHQYSGQSNTNISVSGKKARVSLWQWLHDISISEVKHKTLQVSIYLDSIRLWEADFYFFGFVLWVTHKNALVR